MAGGLGSVFDSAFEKVNNTQRGPVTFSMISHGAKTHGPVSDSTKNSAKSVITGVTYAEQSQLYDFLFNYGFVNSLTELVSSTIKDIVSKSSFEVSLDNTKLKLDQTILSEIQINTNEFLDDINIKPAMLEDLGLYLYFGNYVYGIDYDKRLLKRLSYPHNVISIEEYCKQSGHLLYKTDWKDPKNTKQIKNNECFVFQYNKIKISEATELDAFREDLQSRGLTNKEIEQSVANYLENNPFADQTLRFGYYQGRGIFYSNMQLLLLYYIKELLYDLLGMKDTIRPDIMVARIQDDKTDDGIIANAISNIESLVNDSSAFDTGSAPNSVIQNMLTGIQNYLSNGIKVVPGMANFTNLDALKLPELTGKRSALKEELNDLRGRILSNIGIPEELYNGSSNRWESISRSSRYLTLVDQWVTVLISSVKYVAKSYINYAYPTLGKAVTIEDIQLNLDSNNIIFNNYSNTRSRIVTEKIESVQRLIQVGESLMQSTLSNKGQVLDYIKTSMESIDPKARQCLADNVPANFNER